MYPICWSVTCCVLVVWSFGGTEGQDVLKYFKGGGHSVEGCLEYRTNTTDRNIRCHRDGRGCPKGSLYVCHIDCGFRPSQKIKIGGVLYKFEVVPDPSFYLEDHLKYQPGDNVLIRIDSLIPLQKEDINITIEGEHSGPCSGLSVDNATITCLPIDISLSKYLSFNLTLSYGDVGCRRTHQIGPFIINEKFWSTNIWAIVGVLAIVAIVVLLGTVLVATLLVDRHKKTLTRAMDAHSQEITNHEMKFINLQRKAFLEYQTAVDSFPDLGSLTSRHVLSFINYVTRVLNIELPTESATYEGSKTDNFRETVLDKVKLMKWVERIEAEGKSQQRSLIASLLTIILFQHPKYFLQIIKSLLSKNIENLKRNKEERILFRRSEAVVEKLVGNWITLCLYQSLKRGDTGKRFFNMYRAIKCKINQGLVDCMTHKAKYALTFDHIMLGDIDYQTLNIKADVQVNLKMMDRSSTSLTIDLKGIEVRVLSHDSITQVKEKILDRAMMVHAEMEMTEDIREDEDLCIASNDLSDFRLQFVSDTSKVILEDIDLTSVYSPSDKSYRIINTMKHYNMKSGTKFLLMNVAEHEGTSAITQHSLSKSITCKVHLQWQQDQVPSLSVSDSDGPVKMSFNPVAEDLNKEAYLMRLLATKQSVLAFVEGFFQCLFNWNPRQSQGLSSNSLFETEEQTSPSAVGISYQQLASKQMYLTPIYYLFSMFDEIALSLDVTDEGAISLWKSNSLILRFWVNLIKNPHFIFSVDKAGPIDDSLTTIASVLMESCSMSSDNKLVDVNLPIVKQLFLKEVKEYSGWWRSFIASATKVEEETIVTMMTDIAQDHGMDKYYNSAMASLQAISNTLIGKVLTVEESSGNLLEL